VGFVERPPSRLSVRHHFECPSCEPHIELDTRPRCPTPHPKLNKHVMLLSVPYTLIASISTSKTGLFRFIPPSHHSPPGVGDLAGFEVKGSGHGDKSGLPYSTGVVALTVGGGSVGAEYFECVGTFASDDAEGYPGHSQSELIHHTQILDHSHFATTRMVLITKRSDLGTMRYASGERPGAWEGMNHLNA
jgi:hypothetical protein